MKISKECMKAEGKERRTEGLKQGKQDLRTTEEDGRKEV